METQSLRRIAAPATALLLSIGLSAQAPVATRGSDHAPSELAPAVSAALAPGSISTASGDVPLEIWLAKGLPLEHAPAASGPVWRDVADGALAGAIKVGAEWTDIRGFVVKPGVYTLRYALQPANGDHMGVSPHREFLLMCPADADTTADPLGYDGAVKLAKQTVHRAHPSALSVDPPSTTKELLSPVSNDLGLEGFVLAVPTTFDGRDTGTITFGLILHGTIDA